jgi:hypothetical protein
MAEVTLFPSPTIPRGIAGLPDNDQSAKIGM